MMFKVPKKPETIGTADPGVFSRIPWEPSSRLDAGEADFKKLMDSLKAEGQRSRIIVSPYGVIIDGHRRCAALKLLGMKVKYEVTAVDDHDRKAMAHLFKVLQKGPRRMKDLDEVEIYENEPDAVQDHKRTALSKIMETLGRERYIEFRKLKGTSQNWTFTRWVGGLLGLHKPEELFNIAKWILETQQQYLSRQFKDVVRDTPEKTERVKELIRSSMKLGKRIDKALIRSI
jgi:hypothetical protein